MAQIAVLYHSHHHGNTKQLLEEAGKRCPVDLIDIAQAASADLSAYQAVGLASGIYYGKFHPSVTDFALERAGRWPGGKTFLLYTCGGSGQKSADALAQKLREKGVEVLGSFGCKGFDTYGPFRLIGGIAKGHPNGEDAAKAAQFLKDTVMRGL